MNSSPRAEALRRIATNYVASLGAGDFEAILYAEEVELRAPLCPGGSSQPLIGKANLKSTWWAPLPELVSGVELLDVFVNESLTAVAVEFYCRIDSAACTLRVIDRLQVDDQGLITSQENFFDPSPLTQSGAKDAGGAG